MTPRPKPVYSLRDPRFEVTCEPCRFGFHGGCVHGITIAPPSVFAGSYTCACSRCRLVKGEEIPA